jgi:hypothetical protein
MPSAAERGADSGDAAVHRRPQHRERHARGRPGPDPGTRPMIGFRAQQHHRHVDAAAPQPPDHGRVAELVRGDVADHEVDRLGGERVPRLALVRHEQDVVAGHGQGPAQDAAAVAILRDEQDAAAIGRGGASRAQVSASIAPPGDDGDTL